MARKKPADRVKPTRSRNNQNRSIRMNHPSAEDKNALDRQASYGAYSKHKYNPTAYKLAAYAGRDEDRTYCDAHAGFGVNDLGRIKILLTRGIYLGLWSEDTSTPNMLWTIDDNGWIYELRITNVAQAQYHGYPLLKGDAFAQKVLSCARQVAFASTGFAIPSDPNVHGAIAAAGDRYR